MPGSSTNPPKFAAYSLLLLIAVLLTSACGSGGGGPISVPIDDSSERSEPVFGAVSFVDGRVQLTFTLEEDAAVNGWFHPSEDQEPERATITSLPQNGQLTLRDASATAFRYVPDPDFNGLDRFSYVGESSQEVLILFNVLSVNDPPILALDLPRVAEQGRAYTGALTATDGDGDRLEFAAFGLPPWLTLDPQTGQLSGVPLQEHIGFLNGLVFRVTDEIGLTDEIADVSIEVVDINDAPVINLSQAPDVLYARQTVSFRAPPYDPDYDASEISVEANPYIQATVAGDTIELTAEDVERVTSTQLAVRARDELGAVTRELLDISILPRTASGRGVTVKGYKRGPGIHLVMLGDGYTKDQQPRFREHVDEVIEQLRADPGISAHLGAFNIHRIEVDSVESGSDDRYPVDARDTAFNSGYGCQSIQRLICADTLKILQATLSEYSFVDSVRLQHILLVNDRRYGGSGNSGGSIAITSAYSPEIAIHEMGHSLAGLADEYVDTQFSANASFADLPQGRFPNVSLSSDPLEVPWAHWLNPAESIPMFPGEEGVGIFEGGFYQASNVFRPTYNSRMREFNVPFGPVNSEQWVLRLYTLTDGIRSLFPAISELRLLPDVAQPFRVEPIFGDGVQQVEWELNGQRLDPGEDQNEVELLLPSGSHTLTMTISDISDVIRVRPPHAGIFSWSWNIQVQ